MKAPRKTLLIFIVPAILAAVTVWFLAGQQKKAQMHTGTQPAPRVQIFAHAPLAPRGELTLKAFALGALLSSLDGGLPSTPPSPAADAGEAGATLRGVVIDSFGNAPGACALFFRPAQAGDLGPHSEFSARAATGADGIAAAQGIGPGRWDIFARCEKGIGKVRGVNVAAEGISDFGTIKLEPGGTMRGTVLETGAKKPIPTAVVTVYSPWPNKSMPDASTIFSVTVDQDGRFEIEPVPEGKWNLRVLAEGYLAKDLQGLNTSGRGSVDLQQIFLVKGTVEAIHDNAQFGGIGVSIGRRKDDIAVLSVFDGTPAQNAGLRRGDLIVSVNGLPSSELSVEEIIALIRGDERTAVMLKVRREERLFDINIVRDTITPR